MTPEEEDDINQAAYRRQKEKIKQDYPHGQFVAIDGGQIIADAASFDALQDVLRSMGKNSQTILVVEAGVNYPEYFEFFSCDSLNATIPAAPPFDDGIAKSTSVTIPDKRQLNEAAYGRLREWIDRNYSTDRFVGISDGRIVSDAATFEELISLLRSIGLNPQEVFIVQSGANYPEYLEIL